MVQPISYTNPCGFPSEFISNYLMIDLEACALEKITITLQSYPMYLTLY